MLKHACNKARDNCYAVPVTGGRAMNFFWVEWSANDGRLYYFEVNDLFIII